MASGSNGVLEYNGKEVTYAFKIYCDQEDTLGVGTIDHGLYRFDGKGFEQFMPHKSND